MMEPAEVSSYTRTRALGAGSSFGFTGRLGTWFTSFISVFAPETALRMDIARKSRGFMLRGYEGSMANRWTKSRSLTDGNANQELLQTDALSKLRKLTRDQVRNNTIARSARKALIAHIVGSGFTLQAKATDPNGKVLDDFNNKIERLWNVWAEDCDIRGVSTFDDMCRMGIGCLFDCGEVLVHKLKISKGAIPFKLEMVEPDLLDETYNRDQVIGGIKVNEYGKPLEYNFLKVSPDLYQLTTSSEYNVFKADEIVHVFVVDRPGQVRGEPWLAPSIVLLQMANRAIEAELVATEIQACLTVLYKTNTGGVNKFIGSQPSNEQNATGDRIRKIAPGMIAELPGADDITVVDPKRPGGTFMPFMNFIMRMVASSLDISYEKVSKDFSMGNFSSQRLQDQMDQRHIKGIQNWYARQMCKPIYESFVDSCVLAGLVKVPDYGINRAFYLQHEFTAQPKEYIDPLKDVNADKERLKAGMGTLRDYYSARGKDWQEELRQIGLEAKFAEDVGASKAIERLNEAPAPAQGSFDNGTKNGFEKEDQE